jgi:hypothetical protein
MPFWGRGRQIDARDEVPDETFPYLSVRQVQQIRDLARDAFAERGVEVIVHADHLQADNGSQFGLGNLCATCHNAERGERAWPKLVNSHVNRILAASRGGEELGRLDAAEVLSRTYLRLMDLSEFPAKARGWFTYARPVGSSMLEVLALDSPESVTVIRDEDVERIGLDRLREAGLANLLAAQPDSHEILEAPDGLRIHIVLGDSVYTASKILVFRDVLRRSLGEEREFPNGVLVVAPFRHQIAYTPVEGRQVVQAVNLLAQLAHGGYCEGVAPLSPHVYWWNNGDLTQISVLTESGDLAIEATGPFGETVERLFREP